MRFWVTLALITGIASGGHSEILNCTFKSYLDSESSTMRSRLAPITVSGKTIEKHLVIAGLDSKRVSAKGDIYPINLETVLAPINNNGSHSEWFYSRDFSEAVSIIQLSKKIRKRDTIILYQHTVYPNPINANVLPQITTYFGTCE